MSLNEVLDNGTPVYNNKKLVGVIAPYEGFYVAMFCPKGCKDPVIETHDTLQQSRYWLYQISQNPSSTKH